MWQPTGGVGGRGPLGSQHGEETELELHPEEPRRADQGRVSNKSGKEGPRKEKEDPETAASWGSWGWWLQQRVWPRLPRGHGSFLVTSLQPARLWTPELST